MQSIHINIASPCNENWDKMSPSEQGRFCGSCQKQVVDFTNMSNEAIYDYLKRANSNNQSVCGKTYITQLNTPIYEAAPPLRKTFTAYWKYLSTLLITSLGFSQLKASKKSVHGGMSFNYDAIAKSKIIIDTTDINFKRISAAFSLKIFSHKNLPLVNVQVTLQKNGKLATTNTQGKVEIQDAKFGDVVIITKPGYLPIEATIPATKIIALKQDFEVQHKIMGEIAMMPTEMGDIKFTPAPIDSITLKIVNEQNAPIPLLTITDENNKELGTTNEQGMLSIKNASSINLIFAENTFTKEKNKFIVNAKNKTNLLVWPATKVSNKPPIIMGKIMRVPPIKDSVRVSSCWIPKPKIKENKTISTTKPSEASIKKTNVIPQVQVKHNQEISIFPNPAKASGIIYTKLNGANASYCIIYNINGMTLLTHKLTQSKNYESIQLPDTILPGQYIISYYNNQQQVLASQSFLVE
jgi:hypothetical protein